MSIYIRKIKVQSFLEKMGFDSLDAVVKRNHLVFLGVYIFLFMTFLVFSPTVENSKT